MQKTNLKIGKLGLYINADAKTAKVGSKAKAVPAAQVFGMLPKGEARQLRKQLAKEGFVSIAALSRAA